MISLSKIGMNIDELDAKERAELSAVARQILADPMLIRQLSDRVYSLLRKDLIQSNERGKGYGGQF